MSRDARERISDVRRLLAAADALYRDRARLAPEIQAATGLSPEGVELGFESLERDATDAELRMLLQAAGDAESVHVVLSANVFVAPLRAIAIARAASASVAVRPSPRDPVLARALVRAAGDDAIRIVADRDVGSIVRGEIHVYGRDETIAAIRARARSGVSVRGHGAGLGVALVTAGANLEAAAEAIAVDVAAFDQRGCLSPRVAIALGGGSRAGALAEALDGRLLEWGARVPRGVLSDEERAESARWQETLRFAGHVLRGPHHAVGFGPADGPLLVPPAGRHLCVGSAPSPEAAVAYLSPLARFVVVVGCDDLAVAREVAPTGARVSLLGKMQRPPLDGPVDRRSG